MSTWIPSVYPPFCLMLSSRLTWLYAVDLLRLALQGALSHLIGRGWSPCSIRLVGPVIKFWWWWVLSTELGVLDVFKGKAVAKFICTGSCSCIKQFLIKTARSHSSVGINPAYWKMPSSPWCRRSIWSGNDEKVAKIWLILEGMSRF